MTLNATYAPDLSRVQLVITSATAGADYSLIERSTDQIRWVTVRGGQQVPLVSGGGHLDDFEFTPGVINYYRASHVDTAPSTFIAAGTAATGNNAPVVPAHPAGLAVGHLKLIWASIRNSGAGTVNTPAGWTSIVSFGNVALLGRIHQSGDTAPTVTFTGGVANADTIAQMACYYNAKITPTSAAATSLNSSAQNIAIPALPITLPGMILFLGWKQDDWTSTTTPAFGTKIGDPISTAGDDAGMTWTYFATVGPPTTPSWGGVSLTVTGGVSAISRGATVAFATADYVGRDTANLTPTLADVTGVQKVWLKNLQRPYMNTALSNPVGYLEITSKARAGVFPIIRRSKPVAVTDLRQGREFKLGARVESPTERDRLDLILQSGEPILLHVPLGAIRLKSMYAVIGDVEYDDEALTYTLPLTEVAAPAASIVGVTVLWSDIVATFATWSDLIAAAPTWADVLSRIGNPSDIITG